VLNVKPIFGMLSRKTLTHATNTCSSWRNCRSRRYTLKQLALPRTGRIATTFPKFILSSLHTYAHLTISHETVNALSPPAKVCNTLDTIQISFGVPCHALDNLSGLWSSPSVRPSRCLSEMWLPDSWISGLDQSGSGLDTRRFVARSTGVYFWAGRIYHVASGD